MFESVHNSNLDRVIRVLCTFPDCSNYYEEQSPVCVPHQLNWRDTLQQGEINLWLPYLWREAAEVTSISDIVLTASKK